MRRPSPRVVVRLVDAHPELNQDLLSLPSNQRADRLRSLAAIGLAIWRLGLQGQSSETAVKVAMPTPSSPGKDSTATRYAKRLNY